MDDGPGIAKKDVPFIFDMFYCGNPSRDTPRMGLGLSIVKDVVATHGRTIEFQNRTPHGSRFRITVPATCVL